MADLGEMRVKVGADISELVTGVNKAKAKVVELVTTEDDLKRKILELNAALAKNDSAFEAINKELASLRATAKQSSAAIATLKSELNALSATNLKLTGDLDATKVQLTKTSAQVEALTLAQKEAEVAGGGFSAGLGGILGGLKGLSKIIPGLGLAALASLVAGPVIDSFKAWFNSMNQVSDALKTAKANQENLNDILASSNKEAAKQITDLKILYDAATNVNLSMKDRLAAVKGLQNEFPDYFKNIKTETILNGEAKVSYDAAADSILRMARAKAAINKLQEIGAKQLDNDIQKQKILNATTNEAARAQDRILKQQTTGSSLTGGGGGAREVTITRAEQLKVIEARRDAALKIVEINAKSLKDQADFITKFIGLSDLAKGVETEIKVPKVKKDTESIKHVETIADVLQKLGIQIDFLNQKELLLKTSQAQEKIKAIESTINVLMQKFKLLANDPIIINLEAKIIDIQLTEQFKKVLKFDKDKQFASIPLELQMEMLPEVKIKPGAFDQQILREQIISKLKKLGIDKTFKVDLGFGVLMSEKTGTASLDKLQATLKRAESLISDFNQNVSSELNKMLTDMLVSVGQGIGNVFSGQADLMKGLFDSIFGILGSSLQQLGKVAIETGVGIKAIKEAFKTLNPYVAIAAGVGLIALGTIIKNSIGNIGGFATGGYIQGPGSKTSDSIMARLSAGEYVIKADTVSKFGVGFFDKLNKGVMPKFDSLGFAKFAQGGFVAPSIIRTSQVPALSGISIGGGQSIFIAESRLRGQDIVTSYKRASATISRNS